MARFIVKGYKPKKIDAPIEVSVVPADKGSVDIMVGDYYIAHLDGGDGKLHIHSGVNVPGLETDDEGFIEITKEKE